MKKEFQIPEICVVVFSVSDVITTSSLTRTELTILEVDSYAEQE